MNLSENVQEGFNKALIANEAQTLMTRLSVFLTERKVRAYLVGGLLRDALLGRDTADIDIAIDADAMEIAPQIADEFHGKFVLLDEVNKIGRVILNEWVVDVASFCGNIEEDLKRRDFTIDAMAVDLEELASSGQDAALIDPFNGLLDLDRGIIRSVTDSAFSDDPLRLLRAVRLFSELGFFIERKTETEIKQSAHLISTVAGERLREELMRLLDSSHGGQIFEYMDGLGLLTALIPELIQLKGVSQPAEHHWDVFQHSLHTISTMDFILRQGFWAYEGNKVLRDVPWSPELAGFFERTVSNGSTRRTLLKLAALLHDIAKPQAKAFDENGRMRFLGHPEEGASIAESIMERLRFSTREVKLVSLMVKYHLRPTQMSQEGLPSSRAIYRYYRDIGEVGIDTLYLSLADHLATRGPALLMPQWRYHAEVVTHVLEEHFRKETVSASVKLIDGNDLINVFGMKPGAQIGKLLEEVREAQAANELTTREEALDYIRKSLLTEGK